MVPVAVLLLAAAVALGELRSRHPGSPSRPVVEPGTEVMPALTPRAIVLGGVSLLGLGATAAVLLLVNFSGAEPPDRLDAIRTAATLLVGTGGAAALLLAARRQRAAELTLAVQRRTADATERDAAARRITELYLKAVEQLGSDKAVVRHGGLYALERVAQDNPDQRQTIINVICAYLRSPYAPPPKQPAARRTGLPATARRGSAADRVAAGVAATRRAHLTPPTPTAGSDQVRQEREVRLTAQRILTTHLCPNPVETTDQPTNPRYWAEGYDLDLTGATLIDFHANRLTIRHATFTDVQFTGSALFRGAIFTGDALFDGTSFTRDARFSGTTFTRSALFRRATFTGDALFGGATFTGKAGFSRATFSGNAGFDGTTFTGKAGFSRATFSGNAGFDGTSFTRDARFDETTFTRDARFDGATFTGNAWYGRATFTRDGRFGKATFTRDARFDGVTFTGDARFGKAAFAGDALFGKAAFAGVARFGDATFASSALFGNATFASDALFDGATFASSALFNEVTFTRDAGFSGATFANSAWFNEATFASSALFNEVTFTRDAGFSGATFANSAWFDGATFDSSARFGKATFTDVAVMKGAAAAAASVKWCVWPKGWTVDDHRQETAASGEAQDMLRLVPVPTVLGGPEPSDGLQSERGGSSPE
ncbi:pentapeptide repeat-containing protein [Umezawaea sp. Da 62-37]|uniref:pentapeptide repeat-containing protein n=1 Tax=Umezawaea sp. Da 62-37 TaxID=3075927 RepID=UPI0028F6CF03|nr:pentapeptide repeat-containing protein [Umezawaea sp. Da 62-37]WNV87656.1 pentapeptide repeat-containing protein [Umezawaea sp. Da 62-37]